MPNELIEAQQAAEKLQGEWMDIISRSETVTAALRFPDKDSYSQADKIYNGLHQAWKAGEDQRLAYTGPLNEVLRKINAIFKGRLDPLDVAKKKLKQSMDAYATAEMMWKRKEDARIAEEKRKADEAALAAATKLADDGKEKEADKVIAQAVADVPKPVVGATDDGQSFTKTIWKAEVTDVRLFLHAVGDHPELLFGYVTIEEGQLNRFAQRTKGTERIPGVTIKEVAAVGARR